MSDFKLPDLPSDEELGITDEDRKNLEDLPQDGPELSAQELLALLGDAPSTGPSGEPKDKRKKRLRGRATRATEAAPSTGTGKTESASEGELKKTAPSPRESVGPRSRWRGPITLAALVAMCVAASTRTGLPRPVAANAPDSAFSSARAMATLTEIARRPHPMGSPEHARVRQFLIDRLRSLGMDPQVQTATVMRQAPGAARAVTARNVVARLPGTAPTGAVLVTAHYDSRELSPGAADDGAGVVAILEALRALRTSPPLRNDVIVLFTDAEEACLCGAGAFVAEHPWMDEVSVVLGFEMRGAGGPSIMFETNQESGWIIDALRDFDPHPFANSMSGEVYRRMPNATDFTEFKEAGKQGLNFAAIDRAHIYHQAADAPENLSEATLQHQGLHALAGLRYLGDTDLSAVDGPDVVYFTVPLLGLVVYSDAWVTPISGCLLALALLALLAARARGARMAGVGAGLVVALLGAGLSFGVALWLRTWVLGFYPEAGSLAGSVLHSEGWWVLAATAAAFFIVTAIHGIARKWVSSNELALGAVLAPLGVAVWLGFAAPLAAMNLQWPVAAALLAITAVGLLGSRASGTVGWLATVLLAVPVLFLLAPLTELIWLALSIRLIAPLAVLVAITLHLCLPALDSLRHPNSWWAPATGVAVAAACFGMAILAARPSAARPAPSTLIYAYEHGTGSAVWATDPNADPVLDAQAIEWAEVPAGQAFVTTRDLADFGLLEGPTPVADAPIVEAPAPDVRVLSDSIEGTVRTVSLSVRSRLGAELLRFHVPPAGRTRLLSINGDAVEQPQSLEWAEHWGEPDTAGVVLVLRMPADAPIGLTVVEHLLRPGEVLPMRAFERPVDLAPDVNAMSDRAVFGYSVAAYADPRHAFMPGAAVPAPGAAGGLTSQADSVAANVDSIR
jgi:hypothetical protein